MTETQSKLAKTNKQKDQLVDLINEILGFMAYGISTSQTSKYIVGN